MIPEVNQADNEVYDGGTRRQYLAFACPTEKAQACPAVQLLEEAKTPSAAIAATNGTLFSRAKQFLMSGAGSDDASDQLCQSNYTGPLCGVCAEGFHGGANKPCLKCGGSVTLSDLLTWTMLAAVGLVLVKAMKKPNAIEFLDEQESDTEKVEREMLKLQKKLGTAQKVKEAQGMLRIFVSNYQVIAMMPNVLKLQYVGKH